MTSRSSDVRPHRALPGSVAVAVARRRLHDLPAALPLPGRSTGCPSRPAPPPPAAPSCTPCWSGSSTCPPPSAPSTQAAGAGRARVGAAARARSPSSAALFEADDAADRPRASSPAPVDAARAVLRARGPDPARAGRARAARRGRARVRAAAARLRRPARRARRPATCASSTTRPAARPARASRPRRCSRCASTRWCCGASTGGCPRLLQLLYLGSGEVLRYEPDEADLLATERKVARALGRRSSGPPSPATGGRAPAGCATGATTRPLCPAFGGTPPPLPVPRCPPSRRPRHRRPSPRRRATRSDRPGPARCQHSGEPPRMACRFPRVDRPPVVPYGSYP